MSIVIRTVRDGTLKSKSNNDQNKTSHARTGCVSQFVPLHGLPHRWHQLQWSLDVWVVVVVAAVFSDMFV